MRQPIERKLEWIRWNFRSNSLVSPPACFQWERRILKKRRTGTAVYVFLTLANNAGDGITTLTETNFTIDDGTPTFFRHTPDMATTDFEYQFPAFVQERLEHRTHTLRARISGPDEHLFINFDYAIYT